jgi:hypothetical protein
VNQAAAEAATIIVPDKVTTVRELRAQIAKLKRSINPQPEDLEDKHER